MPSGEQGCRMHAGAALVENSRTHGDAADCTLMARPRWCWRARIGDVAPSGTSMRRRAWRGIDSHGLFGRDVNAHEGVALRDHRQRAFVVADAHARLRDRGLGSLKERDLVDADPLRQASLGRGRRACLGRHFGGRCRRRSAGGRRRRGGHRGRRGCGRRRLRRRRAIIRAAGRTEQRRERHRDDTLRHRPVDEQPAIQ
jgi:hypothetical protein